MIDNIREPKQKRAIEKKENFCYNIIEKRGVYLD